MERFTIRHFEAMFPDDDTCLEWLKDLHHPDGIHCKGCGKITKHHKIKSRRSYSCDICGHHVHPTAGTIYHKSTTPLRLWFYAVYLMSSTRCGISAKQIQRELGVTYKTAWRMFDKIRDLLYEKIKKLSGEVEADESYFGGRRRGGKVGRPGKDSHKTPVFGVVERGGNLVALVTKDASRKSLEPIIIEHVLPRSLIYTDEWTSYDSLGRKGYRHKRIPHAQKIYVIGDVHTNTIEGFWSLIKRGISGVSHSVSAKHLQGYLNEYAFRYNHRDDDDPMFLTILRRA